MSSASPTLRRVILTGSIATITATGAWYGAGWKTQQEYKQKITAAREATTAERIMQLETTRIGLVRTKVGLEKKIRELEGRRMREREREVDVEVERT